MIRNLLSFTLPLSMIFAMTIGPAIAADDPIFNAMDEELARSTSRLQIKGHPKPYFVSYLVTESDTVKISGSFGAITDQDDDHSRELKVDVKVGDYKLDSSSGASGSGLDFSRIFSRGHSHSLTTDNDNQALRRELWLQTDSAYKQAIEGLESNESYLKQNTVEDRPDSFAKEKPVVHIEPTAQLKFDEKVWSDKIRKVSAAFKAYPTLRSSKASVTVGSENHWYINNEGFRYRTGENAVLVTLSAQSQCPDGMRLADEEMFPAYLEEDLPNQAQLEQYAKDLGDRLNKLALAPIADDYRGPIMFEGQAAAEFFHELLSSRLVSAPNPLHGLTGGDDPEKLNVRILPKFINVVDDPQAKEYKGQKLFGTYAVDDEGVEGQKITLVDKGILKTLCIGRTPTRTIKKSNGHSQAGVGATSNLFIVPEKTSTTEALKARLIELGKEDGLKEVYIARKLVSTPYGFDYSSLRSLMRSITSGGGMLFPPVLLYKVSTEDGHEELTRGGVFTNVSTRVLREIEAAGDDSKAYPSSSGHQITSIVAPSVLVKEIEIQKPERSNSKGPVLKNPYFDKQ